MKRDIKNGYLNSDRAKDDYHCFGCSPFNQHGLQLSFVEEGDEVVSYWQPQKHFEGFMNVLHGGIQATLLDEIANWYICVKCGTSGVTTDLSVKYGSPVLIDGGEIRISAKIKESGSRLVLIETRIEQNGKLCCQGDVRYRIFSTEMAKKRFMYPGTEAFFE